MTESLKSVLFVDYDSLHLALRARDPGLARRFAARPGLLLEAIEAGTLIGSGSQGQAGRRILMRRCYADPRTLGKARDSFVGQGFQIVDCPTLPGRERSSAEVQITLDVIDALGHSTAFDEFILLGADTDFTPLIYRLRAHNRAATIFASSATAGGYRAIADGIIEERALVALLAAVEDSAAEDDEEEAARPAAGREDLAGLARRIHNAAAVPLFAPKVYSELFTALTAEIAENGYHFQNTAENVAGRLIASGRKASRRQVAFVVKGLALKGHVLSESDTPEKLASVFREQVLYLARHAGIEIDPRVERQVNAWIAGGNPISEPVEPPAAPEPMASAPPRPVDEPSLVAVSSVVVEPTPVIQPEAAAEPIEATVEVAQDVAIVVLATDEPAVVEAPIPAVVAVTVETLDAAADVLAGPLDADEPSAPVVVAEADKVDKVVDAEAGSAPAAVSTEDLVALAEQTDGEDEPGEEEASDALVVAADPVRAAPAVRPPVPRLPGPRSGARPAEAPLDPFESSLLAAIAEAVQAVDPARADAVPPVVAPDIRIEPRLETVRPRAAEADAVKPVAKDEADQRSAAEAAVDADIGDEIQRILSAYNQNRKPAG